MRVHVCVWHCWLGISHQQSLHVSFVWPCGKGKVIPYSLPSVGPGADPDVHAVSPQVTVSGRLPLLSAGPAFTFISVHQMAPPLTEVTDIQLQLTTYLSTRKGWKAELAWLVDGWSTHTSGHPSATGQARDREISPARDRPSTTVPCSQPRGVWHNWWTDGKISHLNTNHEHC